MAPPVIDQELVVHLFAPLDGPQADEGYGEIQRLWAACRSHLKMTERIEGIQASKQPPRTRAEIPADGLAAAQQSPDKVRQSVLRRVHDVLSLSVVLAQPEGLHAEADGRAPASPARWPDQPPLGWADFAQLWAQASMPMADAVLGEARLFLARMPPGGSRAVAATAELGEALGALLPYREDRPLEWWRWGTTTSAGYAVWDTRLGADTSVSREIILVAAAGRVAELSAWAWSDGTPAFPPFARYLMHAVKLRCEARLLDTWHRDLRAGQDASPVLAEVDAVLSAARQPGRSELLRSRLSRLRSEETRLTALEADLARLQQTAAIGSDNLRRIPGCEPSSSATGLFAADQALAQWLTAQIEDDLGYLRIDLGQVSRVRAVAAGELSQPQSAPQADMAASQADQARQSLVGGRPAGRSIQADSRDISSRVFVVHGRDSELTRRFFDLLHAVRLEPLDWETLVQAAGSATPYLGQVVARAPHLAQATLVLLSPDDIVELHSDLLQPDDQPQERARSGQARPNVLFELGLALMAYPDHTVVVEVGHLRPVADLAGLNVIRFDGSAMAIRKVLDRLRDAGCPVDDSRNDWLDPGRFAGLAAYQRGPASHRALQP